MRPSTCLPGQVNGDQRAREPSPPRRSGLRRVVTCAVATLIAFGVLIGTTMLFQSRGMPMAKLTAAERACAGQTYVSDRERCMREWVTSAHGDWLAEGQQAHRSPMSGTPMQCNTLRFAPELSRAYGCRVATP